MDIILLERVAKLGNIGDVVTVKDGYARNFLLPSKKALRSNNANRTLFEANRVKIESDNADRRGVAEVDSKDVDGKTVILIRASSNSGQLYGSVSVRDIIDALNAEGAKLTRTMIVLERPIKTIGMFDVKVSLHPEVSVMVKVNVARSTDEAAQQEAGVDVLKSMFEEDAVPTGFTEAFDPNAEPGEIAAEEEAEPAAEPAAKPAADTAEDEAA